MDTKLQIALDLIDVQKAHSIIEEIVDFIDIIEIGTPMIKAFGTKIIKDFKKYGKPINADLKTMDVGGFEASIAIDDGADLLSVLACSSNKTIEDFIDTCKRSNVKSIVDLICVKDKLSRIKELNIYNPDFFLVHTGIDEQNTGLNPIDELNKIEGVNLMVAGGITAESIGKINTDVKVIIVGGAITKSDSPSEAAKSIKDAIIY